MTGKPAIELAKRAIAGEKAFGVYFPDPAKDMAELGSAVMAAEGVHYWISPGGDSITCTKCRMTSRNPSDIEQRYCGNCHMFHKATRATEKPGDPAAALALFETMRTDELRLLLRAHEADQAQATRPELIVFGAGRLALIAHVLKSRETQ